MPPPRLPDEIIEEIFLRLPPNKPACLVCASLASRLWLALLSGPSFQIRYCEFHGTPPMLGFIYFCPMKSAPKAADEGPVRGFVSTMKFGARIYEGDMREWDYYARDCRHGRVVLGGTWSSDPKLVIWKPMTGGQKELYLPKPPTLARYTNYGAAVLCGVTGCDHHTCHQGPFRVVLVGLDMTDDGSIAFAHVSKPYKDAGSKSCSYDAEWSEPCSGLHLPEDAEIDAMPPILIDDALYFMLSYDYNYDYDGDDFDDYDCYDDDHRTTILKYNLVSNFLSLIDGPLAETHIVGKVVLIVMEGGNLGFARVNMSTLYLWSRNMGSDRVAPWTACKVIDLKEFLPIQNPKKKIRLIGSMEGSDIIFVTTDLGIYEISLKTLSWKKIWKSKKCLTLIPYMSFYKPRERPSPALTTHE
ncbi:unnamed protein product [Alopecurus aequalis]